MSYDIRLGVKVDGTDIIAVIGAPERDCPTYNLGQMFRAATGWDYEQSEWYRCSEVIGNIENGIKELQFNSKKYKQYEPDNGWGNVGSALCSLVSLRDYIYEMADEIPIEHLWVKW